MEARGERSVGSDGPFAVVERSKPQLVESLLVSPVLRGLEETVNGSSFLFRLLFLLEVDEWMSSSRPETGVRVEQCHGPITVLIR